ncbi:hypothetical protein AA313_de0209201 [Arthrobotrys entomopaga]|nr:hypothetical protein AA313_de0209201 [Arthrobotrys entomopaga]
MAKEWTSTMIRLLCVQKRLQEEGILSKEENIFGCRENKEAMWTFVRDCLRAGSDRYAISTEEMVTKRDHMIATIQDMLKESIGNRKLFAYFANRVPFPATIQLPFVT